MSMKYLMRDFPDLEPEKVTLPKSGRLAVILFVATHGLWLALSLAGLVHLCRRRCRRKMACWWPAVRSAENVQMV